MSGNSSVDLAALRREARRRKILENSEKRLRSITGRPVSNSYESQQDSGHCLLHDFQNAHRRDVFEEPNRNTTDRWDDEKDLPSYDLPDIDDIKENVIINRLTESTSFESTWVKSLVQRRFHLIVLPVIVQLLYIFQLGHLFYNNLFCPFITVKLMEFLLVHDPFEMYNQEKLLLIFAMLKGSMARHLLKACVIFAVIASDFFLYIFMIVASDKLFNVTISKYFAQ